VCDHFVKRTLGADARVILPNLEQSSLLVGSEYNIMSVVAAFCAYVYILGCLDHVRALFY
jgi:hypothetical protein